MSLLYLDSWGMITDVLNDGPEIHYSIVGGSAAKVGTARYPGSPSGNLFAGTVSSYLCWKLPVGVTYPLWFGYAIKPIGNVATVELMGGDGLGHICGFDPTGTTSAGLTSLAALLTPNRGIAMMQRNGWSTGELLSVSDPCMPVGDAWYWVEGCIELTTGHGNPTRTIIKVNGNVVADETGTVYAADAVDPYRYFAIGLNTGFGWGGVYAGNCVMYPMTDFYLCDSAGSAPYNTWLGEIQIECLLPNGDSATYVEWTPTGGGAHYTQVDDTTPDDDTTYVAAPVTKRDAYTRPALTNTVGTVLAVQTMSAGRLVDPYADHYQDIIVRRAGSDGLVAATVTEQNRFTVRNLFSRAIMTQDPTDSSAWTIAKVNAAEIGPRRA